MASVTPGYVWTGTTDPITHTKLNLTATPSVTIGAAEVTGTMIANSAIGVNHFTTAAQSSLGGLKNIFVNGTFLVWQRGTTAKSCTAAAKTFRADRWFCRPVGAATTYAADTLVPASGVSRYSARIVGATSVTTVDFGQMIESIDVITNCKRTLTFSASIYNGTSADFTPTLRVATPSAADVYTTNTNRLDATLDICTSGAWTNVKYTFDPSAYTNIDNGMEVCIRIPSGSLNSNTKSVQICQCQLEGGSYATTPENRFYTLELLLSQRYCLVIGLNQSGNSQVIGFAAGTTGTSENNLTNKGLFTYPTTMRIAPSFEGTVGNAGTEDNYFTVTAGSRGTPVLSGYASETMGAFANSEANWTATAQVNLTCKLVAEPTG